MLKKFSWLSTGLFLVIALALTNCKDDKNSLGLDIQPPNDKINVFSTDTVSIVSYSQLVDSVKTDETTYSLLGSMVDPVFGSSTASFYTQFRLAKTAFDFGTTPYPDSLVLALDYQDIYGDTLAPITVKVYELAEPIFVDSVYYSQQSLALSGTLLGEKTFVPNLKDSLIVLTDTLVPHLRIRLSDLSNVLADKLLFAPSDSMSSNTSFLNYFYGLGIIAETTTAGGAIIYFDLMSAVSQMTLYYHNGEEDSLSFNYVINSNCGRFGHFTHDYSLGDAAFKAQVIDKDTSLGKNTCYVQALGGVKTFIRFPHVKNLYDNGKIAINEARFFLSCQEVSPALEMARVLVLVQKNSDSSYTILNDQLEGSGYYGGYYDDDENGYWFRITSTVQELIRSEESDFGLEIYMSGGAINAERVLLYGSNPALPENAEDRMKLVLTYTTLN
jgi:hypothetical protein